MTSGNEIQKLIAEGRERHRQAVIKYVAPAAREVLSKNCVCGFRWPCFAARLLKALEEAQRELK
jgi:hypothetical protein